MYLSDFGALRRRHWVPLTNQRQTNGSHGKQKARTGNLARPIDRGDQALSFGSLPDLKFGFCGNIHHWQSRLTGCHRGSAVAESAGADKTDFSRKTEGLKTESVSANL